MYEYSKQPTDRLDYRGLRCPKCNHQRFRVIYTRRKPGGRLVRRRQCRACGARITTWEHIVGW